ncbi:MAG: Clp protease N-terminal domain-containing protein, partial [Myxococcales bacterium]
MAVTIHKDLEAILGLALEEARRRRHEYLTLEHVLLAMAMRPSSARLLEAVGADVQELQKQLDLFFMENMEVLEKEHAREPEQTAALRRVFARAAAHVQSSGRQEIEAGDILAAIYREPDSHAAYLLEEQGVTRLDVLNYISHGISRNESEPSPMGGLDEDEEGGGAKKSALEQFCVNLNERAAKGQIDPLIGRAPELARTLQVLCRRRRNNPVFVGEPGVGKTAIVEGLALAIHEKKVPSVLAEATIYSLEMGTLLAGTKFRGQFE